MSKIVVFKRQKVIFDPLMEENYHAYLKSEEWKEKRRAVIQRAEGCCENCGSYIGNRGEVHHNTYERLFEEESDDLTYVCADCHP